MRRECCLLGEVDVCRRTYGGDQEAKGNGLLGARHAERAILRGKGRTVVGLDGKVD